MKDLIQSLIYIQQHLIVPKDQFNSFGKYNYRSLESILAAIKPLLRSQNCGIRFEDEVIELGGRTFLKTRHKDRHGRSPNYRCRIILCPQVRYERHVCY